MAKLVRTGHLGVRALGYVPTNNSDPRNIYEAFQMDFAVPLHNGAQENVTLRDGTKIKCGDQAPYVYTMDYEFNSIFGYKNEHVIPYLGADNRNRNGMFKGSGMNFFLGDHYNSDNSSHNFVWSVGSNTVGNPIRISGMTFTISRVDKVYKANGSSAEGGGKSKTQNDFQLNRIFGMYLNPDNGNFLSLPMLPEGNNYNDNQNMSSASRYIFRNSDKVGDSSKVSTHLLGDNSHFEKYGKDATITVCRNAADRVPPGYLFCGFDFSVWMGRVADVNKKKCFTIHDLRVHDERTVAGWHAKGNYGSYSGRKDVNLVPHHNNRSTSTRYSAWNMQLL